MAFRYRFATASIVAATLVGCGGGGGAEPAASMVTLGGVAAIGSPIKGGKVDLRCGKTGELETSATTDDVGRWSVSISSDKLPCNVRVSGGDLPARACYYSVAVSPGTVNITPLTDALVQFMGFQGPATRGGCTMMGLVSASTVNAGTLQAATTTLKHRLSLLPGLERLAGIDPLTTPFVAVRGDPMDDLLESFGAYAADPSQLMFMMTDLSTSDAVFRDFAVGQQRGMEAAWRAAVVYLPYATSPTDLDALKSAGPVPVALGFHGCKGLGSLPGNWGPALASLGYAVIFPDSLAREDRAGRFTCEGTATGVGQTDDIYYKRIEEVHAAIRYVRQSPWWNGSKLLVAGHSEGGWAVEMNHLIGATAKIVSGYWCAGQRDPIPTLTVNYREDPFYFGKFFAGTTESMFPYRCVAQWNEKSRTDVLLDGAFHNAFDTELGRKAVMDFARSHMAGEV